jgi:hypothetical protein
MGGKVSDIYFIIKYNKLYTQPPTTTYPAGITLQVPPHTYGKDNL